MNTPTIRPFAIPYLRKPGLDTVCERHPVAKADRVFAFRPLVARVFWLASALAGIALGQASAVAESADDAKPAERSAAPNAASVTKPFVAAADLPKDLFRQVSPFNVGNRAQLFVDRVLVRETDRVWFTQHRGTKHAANPLMKADQPWEGWRLQIYGTVLYDEEESLFKMWYLAIRDGADEYFDDGTVTCYATSRDGVHWEKPLVGTLPAKNGKPHNAVTHHVLASVVKDKNAPDPAARYKMVCWRQREPMGYHTLASPDGLHWNDVSKTPITPGADVITAFWDPDRQLHVAFPKQGRVWRGHSRRLFSTITSKDFVHWSDPVASWTTDLRDDAGALARIEEVRPNLDRPDNPDLLRTEYYGMGVYPAESCSIGFPWIFTVNNEARWGNQEGPLEVQLAVSRDLVEWERPFRTRVIGFDGTNTWDCGDQATAASAFRFNDEIRLYYCGGNNTHGTPALYRDKFEDGSPTGRGKITTAIGLVTWKLDRFVSADGPAEGGTLATVPIRFSGKRLEINAATKQDGCVVVEICDAAGKPIAGYGPSAPISGDSVRHVVTFHGDSDVSRLAGTPIVLRIRLQNAELYSFAFRD